MTTPFTQLLESRQILVCCGPGGVGKTTTAAALALGGAMLGRRACVVTVDPAKRLADALGIAPIGGTPHQVPGEFSGTLFAVALDVKSTFDELVDRNAKSAEQAERIKINRLYRNLASTLSGTSEYMATEKIYELAESGEFDIIVVDTPPSRHALDFLDAPGRLAAFLDNRVFRLVSAPSHASLKMVNVAAEMLLRTIGRVAGREIVEDTIAFFRAFDGMEEGFRVRAANVERLLDASTTGFVLISTPRRDALDELADFARHVERMGRTTDALVINRVQPGFGKPLPVISAEADRTWNELTQNLADLSFVEQRERSLIAEARSKVEPAPVVEVPLLDIDVHDVAGLAIVVRHLL